MTFPEGLKRFRNEFHLTQKSVAYAIDLHESAYQRYEQGRSTPSITLVAKLADTFNVSIDYLVGRTDNPAINN